MLLAYSPVTTTGTQRNHVQQVLCTSIATLAVAFSPVAAEAALYEAIWQVQITETRTIGQGLEISRPTSFEYKVRFSDEVWYVDDEFEPETSVFLNQAAITHERPATTYLPERPEGGSTLAYNNFYSITRDDVDSFGYSVATTEHEIIDAGDLYWQHSTHLQFYYAEDSRGGTGENDYPMLASEMIAFLKQSANSSSGITSRYLERIELESGQEFTGIWWISEVQLTSLREPEATDVSEPPLLALLGTGLAGIGLLGRRKRHLQKEAC